MIPLIVGPTLLIAYCVLVSTGNPQFFLSELNMWLLSGTVGIISGTLFMAGMTQMLQQHIDMTDRRTAGKAGQR